MDPSYDNDAFGSFTTSGGAGSAPGAGGMPGVNGAPVVGGMSGAGGMTNVQGAPNMQSVPTSGAPGMPMGYAPGGTPMGGTPGMSVGGVPGMQGTMGAPGMPMNGTAAYGAPSTVYGGPGGAMPGNGMPMSTGTGDIVLGDGGGGKKKWLAVLLVLVVVMVIGIVAIVVLRGGASGGFSSRSYKEKWNDYYDYLMYGPDDAKEREVTINSWYPELMKETELENESYNDHRDSYYNDLEEKFDSFYNQRGERAVGDLTDYSGLFDAFVAYNTIEVTTEALEEKFLKDGEGNAANTIENFGENINVENAYASSMLSFIKRYLASQLSLMQKYKMEGCYNDTSLDEKCTEGATFAELNELLSMTRFDMNNYYNVFFENVFYNQTNELNKIIKER
ncbi:hypothetical protein IKG60_01885 [Candidatus Saccharibacteria bacterium]|nr:hypothetical protein [Candidatus Saccharibacteria bacterium]